MIGIRRNLAALPKRKADFIEPMDCAPVTKLAGGPGWVFEIKLDGYRAIAVKADGRVNFNLRFPQVRILRKSQNRQETFADLVRFAGHEKADGT